MKYDEQTLWIAVVEQAIREATGKSEKPKNEAYKWINNSQSFETVCELANLDSEHIKNMLSKIIGEKENFNDWI